jgi:hypothetical protein
MIRMNTTLLAEQLMKLRVTDSIVRQHLRLRAGGRRKKTKGFGFNTSAPPAEFGTDGAITFRCPLVEVDVCFVLYCSAMTASVVCFQGHVYDEFDD